MVISEEVNDRTETDLGERLMPCTPGTLRRKFIVCAS